MGDNTYHSDIMLFAFRYALGRLTSAPYTVMEYIIQHESDLLEFHKRLIIKEIDEAVLEGRAGMAFDVKAWLEFAGKLKETDNG